MPAHTSAAEDAKRLALYQLDWSDGLIADSCGVSKSAILHWRTCRNLPRRSKLRANREIPKEGIVRGNRESPNERIRYELHAKGWNDKAIAEACDVDPSTILSWRHNRGLPRRAGTSRLSADGNERRLAFYRQGLSDAEIAKAEGITSTSILNWRRRNALAPNHPSEVPPAEHGSRLLLYELGWSDAAIAEQRECSSNAIRAWRRGNNLKPIAIKNRCRNTRKSLAGLATRARRSVGFGLAPDIAEEATQHLLVDLLNGEVALKDLEKRARSYGSKALAGFASSYKFCSIDEEIGEDGFTLLDTMADESQSSWLEEMGATVW